VRRPSTVELMLLSTIVLWSLNLTMSRYVLTHGFQPLAYSSLRYGLGALIFVALTLLIERSLRLPRRDLVHAVLTAVVVFANQVAFVYALDRITASVLGLILGATPVFAGIFAIAARIETPPPRFWVGALLSFAGVGLVAVGSGGEVSGDLGGVLLGVLTAGTWAAYSILVTPLMRRHSATKISAVVIGLASILILLAAIPQLSKQDFDLGWMVWLLFVAAVVGPLVVTNELWFRTLDRIGPSRATLAANLQPFLAAAIAVVLLSETLTPVELAGGVLIAAGILVARRRRVAAPPGE
jgi:drug/metabolite transporter (DMT)-like permease